MKKFWCDTINRKHLREGLTFLWVFIVGLFAGGALALVVWHVIEPSKK